MISFRDYLDNKENLCEGKQAPIFKVSSKNDDVCKALEDIDGFSVRDWDAQPIVATKWFDSDWEIKITVNPDWRTGKLVVSVDLVNDRGRSIRHKDVRNERELLNIVEEYEELEMRMNENVSEALDKKLLDKNGRIKNYPDLTPNASEIDLFINNDEKIYKSKLEPIYNKLASDNDNEQYSSEKAVDAFAKVVDLGLKTYNSNWPDKKISLSKDEKLQIAVGLAKSFEDEYL